MLPLGARNVLVCLRYGIGDVIMETPVLDALREALPDARITALANRPADELLHGDPRVDRLVLTERWGIEHRWDQADEARRREIASWVVLQDFDVFLDVAQAPVGISRAIWSLGVRSLESCDRCEATALKGGKGGVEAIAAGVRAGWGLAVPEQARPRVRPRLVHRRAAGELIAGFGGPPRPYAVSPVASNDLKRWPIERFAAVADHIVERGLGPVVVLEGPQADAGAALVEAMRYPDQARRVGQLHLLETAAVLERCRGLIVNDTGLMHLAAAVDTPAVVVFGPTRGDVFRPRGRGIIAAEPRGIDCTYRAQDSLGPPACWAEGRCLIADRSCIHGVRASDVIGLMERFLLDAGAPARLPTTRAPAAAAFGSR